MGKIYIGINDTAKQIKAPYIGVGGVAKKIKKIYLGVAGVAKKVWQSGFGPIVGSFTKNLVYGNNDNYEEVLTSTDYQSAIAEGYTQFTINAEWKFYDILPAGDHYVRFAVYKVASSTEGGYGSLYYSGNQLAHSPGPATFTHTATYNLADLTNQQLFLNCRINTGGANCDVTYTITFS